MAFMEPEITDKEVGYRIETSEGTFFIPASVSGLLTCPTAESVRDYCEGKVETIAEVTGYFGRYSASGYLDSTDWYFNEDRAALEQELDALYGSSEDDEMDDEWDCPACDGPVIPMGRLGNLEHGRCRNCGLDCNRKA